MAEEKQNSGQNNSPQKKSINVTKPKKSINVTKPKKSTLPPMSNIDTTKVSSHTVKEQQALERLKKKVGVSASNKQARSSTNKTVIVSVLSVILVAILVVMAILLFRQEPEEVLDSPIKVSMDIENKSVLSVVSEEGYEVLRPIWPGDKLPLKAYARNSNNYKGDAPVEGEEERPVYVRFKIRFILGYEDRYDILIPTMTDKWLRFDAETESMIVNGAKEDDYFYYYCGIVEPQKRIELFSEIEFDGNKITIDDAGKYGQIQVLVESIDASVDNLKLGIWPTAPQRWILDMEAGRYNNN